MKNVVHKVGKEGPLPYDNPVPVPIFITFTLKKGTSGSSQIVLVRKRRSKSLVLLSGEHLSLKTSEKSQAMQVYWMVVLYMQ